jgi:hypothetical protein
MFLRRITNPSVPAAQTGPYRIPDSFELSHKGVQSGLNLFLTLKSPAQMPALLRTIAAIQPTIDDALASLHYVHFARFLPSLDFSTLMVITVFDGNSSMSAKGDAGSTPYLDSLDTYLMDFVAVLGDAFTAMLEFVQNAPRLPVKQYPLDFLAFVAANSVLPPLAQPWSAYPDMTVIDIQNARSAR